MILLATYGEANRPTPNGRTLLHLAVRSGSFELVGLLLAYGADPTLPDGFGRTARDLARTDGTPEIREMLAGEASPASDPPVE